MATEHRDALTSGAGLSVPLALSNLDTAEQALHDNKPVEALKAIRDARALLDMLCPLFDAACQEALSGD
jgi:hypothetical protein